MQVVKTGLLVPHMSAKGAACLLGLAQHAYPATRQAALSGMYACNVSIYIIYIYIYIYIYIT